MTIPSGIPAFRRLACPRCGRNSPALWPGRAGAPRKSSGCRCPTMARTASAAIACEMLPGKSRLARLLERPSSRALLHHGRGLPEQQLALFLGADRGLAVIRIDLLGFGVGANRGRPLADGLEPALRCGK